jgi:predicted nucleic acid-binding protein
MTGFVVVDASLATMWAIPEPYTEQALALAILWARQDTRPIAPCLILTEITNAIYKRVRRREINLKTAQEALHIVLRFDIEIREEAGLHARALELAHDLKLTTTYDAHYLALAEQQGCHLWTGDKKLYHAVHKKLPWVRWVGHLTPSIL